MDSGAWGALCAGNQHYLGQSSPLQLAEQLLCDDVSSSRLFVTAFPFISPVKPPALPAWFFPAELLDPHKPIPPCASLEMLLESLESWPSKGADKMGISILKQPESPRVCTQGSPAPVLPCTASSAGSYQTMFGFFYKPWAYIYFFACWREGCL